MKENAQYTLLCHDVRPGLVGIEHGARSLLNGTLEPCYGREALLVPRFFHGFFVKRHRFQYCQSENNAGSLKVRWKNPGTSSSKTCNPTVAWFVTRSNYEVEGVIRC